MRYTVQYKKKEEREEYINQAYAHMTLVEERNVTEGNFLTFDDSVGKVVISPERLEALEKLVVSQVEQDKLIMSIVLGGM